METLKFSVSTDCAKNYIYACGIIKGAEYISLNDDNEDRVTITLKVKNALTALHVGRIAQQLAD